MSTTAVRRLDSSDATALHAIRLQALEDCPDAFGASFEQFSSLTPAQREQWARDRLSTGEGGVWGAFLGDRLVGMVGLKREDAPKARHKAMVWGMYVSPEARGQGLGRQLVESAIAHAQAQQGLEWVHLSVVPSQAAAVALYRALGFQEWGIEPAALKVAGRDLDEAHMALRLT